MLTYSDLKKGTKIILDGQPYEILEARPMKKARRQAILQTRIRDLISGSVFSRNFQPGDTFETAEVLKFKAKLLYSHKNRYFFSEKDNPAKRFDLGSEQIGEGVKFLKSNQIVEGLIFKGKIINISLPIKVQLKVIEAPPAIKGERAQPGTKQATLETGAKINVPIFIEEGNTIEINTETGEYVRRIE
ncbi:elongation factor P [Patescibacteria group bacterium]|nr:elongation factor P [Patescibacteria group bacterium]